MLREQEPLQALLAMYRFMYLITQPQSIKATQLTPLLNTMLPRHIKQLLAGLWSNTAAITSAAFTPTANNFESVQHNLSLQNHKRL
jgi:hypothetical protein